jgi:hypothetical protein
MRDATGRGGNHGGMSRLEKMRGEIRQVSGATALVTFICIHLVRVLL